MSTQVAKTLQERIAKEAMDRVGEKYGGLCGDLVKDILSTHNINIPPRRRLRLVGREVPFEEREAGDLLFLYDHIDCYQKNEPLTAGILVEKKMYVSARSLMVGLTCFTVIPGATPRIHVPQGIYTHIGGYSEPNLFARVRRLE